MVWGSGLLAGLYEIKNKIYMLATSRLFGRDGGKCLKFCWTVLIRSFEVVKAASSIAIVPIRTLG
jgi:hypothetical protein